MKKTLYFLLFTLSVIALAGCSGNKQPAQEPVATEEPSSEIPSIQEPIATEEPSSEIPSIEESTPEQAEATEEEHDSEELAEVQSEILGDWSFYAAGNRMHIDASTLTITIFSTGPGGKILQEDTYNYVIEKNPEDVRARYDIRATESNANGYTPEFFFLATDPGHLYGFPSSGGEEMIVYYKDN